MPNQYLDYGCCNIVDGCRTLAYAGAVNHAISDSLCTPGAIVSSCTCCVNPDPDDLPASGEFVSPMADPAPWYNALDPRSQHYFGAMIVSWKESQPYLREAVDTTTGGRTKRAKLQRKEVVVRFMLVVDDCCAIDFAKAYFLNQFICASSGVGACALPPLHWHECYNKDNCQDFQHSMRGFSGAALTGLQWLDDEMSCCLGVIGEATFAAEFPWVYEVCPENIVTDQLIINGEPQCNFCKQDPCPEPAEACPNPCLPLAIDIPAVEFDVCYCEPFTSYRNCFTFMGDTRIGESTFIIKIFTGSSPMRNFRLRGWANPLGLTDPDLFYCQDTCFDYAFAGPIPANATIEIDGVNREIWITCNNVRSNGRSWVESLDGSPFQWPDVTCNGLLVCLDASAVTPLNGTPHTAADATVTIDRYHREIR